MLVVAQEDACLIADGEAANGFRAAAVEEESHGVLEVLVVLHEVDALGPAGAPIEARAYVARYRCKCGNILTDNQEGAHPGASRGSAIRRVRRRRDFAPKGLGR